MFFFFQMEKLDNTVANIESYDKLMKLVDSCKVNVNVVKSGISMSASSPDLLSKYDRKSLTPSPSPDNQKLSEEPGEMSTSMDSSMNS